MVAVAAALHGGAGDVVMLDYEPAALHCALLGARASGARLAAAEGDLGDPSQADRRTAAQARRVKVRALVLLAPAMATVALG